MITVRLGEHELVLASGKTLKPGQVVELEGKEAVRLVALGLARFETKNIEKMITGPLEKRVFCWPGA